MIRSNNKHRIAICGKSRAGKDLVASKLREMFQARGNTVVTHAFADGIKDIYKQHFYKVHTNSKPRDAYIAIGETFRSIYPNVWVDKLKSRVEESYQWDVQIITDLRRLNEEEYLREAGFTIVYVYASDDIRIARAASLGEILEVDNDGDAEVDKIKYDIKVDSSKPLTSEEISQLYNELVGE